MQMYRNPSTHVFQTMPGCNWQPLISTEPMERKGILLGYSEYTVEQIQDGIRRLAEAMHSL